MVTRNDADILHADFIMPCDKCAHALVGTVFRRRFTHKYFQSPFFAFFEMFFARVRPYFYADESSIIHTRCACIVL